MTQNFKGVISLNGVKIVFINLHLYYIYMELNQFVTFITLSLVYKLSK
jgi:hypothetical protein